MDISTPLYIKPAYCTHAVIPCLVHFLYDFRLKTVVFHHCCTYCYRPCIYCHIECLHIISVYCINHVRPVQIAVDLSKTIYRFLRSFRLKYVPINDQTPFTGRIQFKVLITLPLKFHVFYGKNWKSKKRQFDENINFVTTWKICNITGPKKLRYKVSELAFSQISDSQFLAARLLKQSAASQVYHVCGCM